MTEPQPIKFEDIRGGDTIRREANGVTIQGVVYRLADHWWMTREPGGYVAHETHTDLLLVHRPVAEPIGLDAVVIAGPARSRHASMRLRTGGWLRDDGHYLRWSDLIDPEVKWEGWQP